MAGDAGPEPDATGAAPPEPEPEPVSRGDAPPDAIGLDDDGERGWETAAPSIRPEAGGPIKAPIGLDDDGERGGETAAPSIRPEAGRPINAPIGGPAAGERTVEKTASADFPPVVLPKSTHKLRVAIASEAIYGVSGTVTITAPADQRSVDLRVGVSAEHFAVVADDAPDGERRAFADIVVDLDDPKHVAEADFRLTAHDLAEAIESNVFVTFFLKNLPVGHLALAATIDPAFEPQRSEIRLKLGEGRPRDPDYVLLVADRSIGAAGTGPFAIAAHREGRYFGKPLGDLTVKVGALEHSQALLQEFRLVREEPDKEERIRQASQLGVQLWEQMPEAFRTFYWEELHPQEGASIAIYSEEPYFPWELIRPQRETAAGIEEADFLGIRYAMARWTANVTFPDPLVVERFSVIAPDYPDASGYRKLPKAQEEATALEAAFGARRTPANRTAVRGLLESQEGIQLIHFAGHGEFKEANANASSIGLEDGDLTTGDLTRAQLGRASHPFVFLNACEVGDHTFALTRIGGWAASFVARGFSGFVGPYWAVNDRIAGKASMAFYDALADDRTVGEAIRSVRRRFYDDPEDRGHPSWLAYTLHCQPNIHVGVSRTAAAGAPAAAGGGDQ